MGVYWRGAFKREGRLFKKIKFCSRKFFFHCYIIDNREEAQEYDKYAIGIYKKNNDGSEELAGHAPIELSSLLYHFPQASAENCVNVEIIGKRKREVGLVVPAKYDALTKNKKISMVLEKELSKRKNMYKSCLELKHQQKKIYRMFPVYKFWIKYIHLKTACWFRLFQTYRCSNK